MNILILAEHDGVQLKPASLCAISAASQLAEQCSLVVIGDQIDSVCQHAASVQSVKSVLSVSAPHLQPLLAEDVTQVLASIADDYEAVIVPATTFGKNILPRLAALCDVMPITDVIAIEDPTTFKRPIYAGNAIETIKTEQSKLLLAIRPTAFEAAKISEERATIISLSAPESQARSRFIKLAAEDSKRPELTSAAVVVAGGRGLGNSDNFSLLEQLADKLQAAIGASRAAVDSGFVPNDWQVGQTGKVVAPALYIAVGISGAIQHIAGMKDSKVIVAINKDADAPIFEVADYGIVGDLFEIVPELIEQL